MEIPVLLHQVAAKGQLNVHLTWRDARETGTQEPHERLFGEAFPNAGIRCCARPVASRVTCHG
ncbi:hypothetical protein LBMAG44_04790 [Gemmatimonadota bacterium]|nr:hypothetical protein LBMAG44_04790 [Gemmatimonadota bacterium]